MEFILLLISSGIPGFYTYYSLSNKNIIYFNSDNKNVLLSFFSIISILIFLLILSLFSGINNVNELFNNLSFTKIVLALVTSVFLIVILTELIYPILLELYNVYINYSRSNKSLSNVNTLPIHIERYEDENFQIVIFIKTFDNHNVDSGLLVSYSRKENRNIIIQNLNEDELNYMLNKSTNDETYVDFDNKIKLKYYYIPTNKIKK